MNEVNEDNFNETCKGYVYRALKIARGLEGEKLTFEQEKTVLRSLIWAFDELSLEKAREEEKER